MYSNLVNFFDRWGPVIFKATGETLQMVLITITISLIIGLPLGVLLILTRPGKQYENKFVYLTLNSIINMIRSVPFIILLFFLLPFTKFLVGTSIGVKGVLVPLVIYTSPYVARLMENALLEVDSGVIEAYTSMGISPKDIIWHVLIREARPSIVLGMTIAIIGLIGATAMAGLVGAGGLGDLAYRYGHLRYQTSVMRSTVLILILLVQSIQTFGNRLSAKLKKD
ncbi:methionine ABC transporter permease [Serpentinicella alkaliphila]|uniref:D-methionine transport system permease protein n=1 Tax=Serpentinicella alkaliphila TaxID=1734049 RepID=A0A4R2U2B4_9FIRM|nr:methionine ABC transporter permease [Serpentinicella alkaliphila]QUH25126.1 ABC transporter permease [Serpentinicella alkaliphila]TCQ01773.1 D-methionine transport system permease protein [Serpentinicella alkaliphila]